ncbi:MAG TPA: hypothetical protein VFG62_15875 [Rhodopila sp.]|jgi:hypothetical protein|nr:hypothetical protein [Rhodopila sp.]
MKILGPYRCQPFVLFPAFLIVRVMDIESGINRDYPFRFGIFPSGKFSLFSVASAGTIWLKYKIQAETA